MEKCSDTILEVKDLKQYFNITTGFLKSKPLKAVDGVTFSIKRGETLGLVGESGCGKTTVGRTILHLYPPTGGDITFNGVNIKTKQQVREMRRRAQIVFQDPYSSLNPRMTVGDIIAEPLDVNNLCSTKAERAARVKELMDAVDLSSEHATRYAHEFSGGQRQRIGIARVLVMQPELIIADEPISALDVSIRAQVLNLLADLQAEYGLTYLFIAHDLSVMRYITNRLAVIHKGRLVELAKTEQLFEHPLHPYTKALLSAIPQPDPLVERERTVLTYAPSCHHYENDAPEWMELEKDHFVLANEEEAAQYRKEVEAK